MINNYFRETILSEIQITILISGNLALKEIEKPFDKKLKILSSFKQKSFSNNIFLK